MDFITQFENTLEQTLDRGHIAEARQLADAFPNTQQPYTLKLFSLINRLRRLEQTPHSRFVLFLTGNFILDYILQQFLEYFSEKGFQTCVFDPGNYSKSTNELFSFAKDGVDGTFFFNNVGLLQTLQDGRNLWETLEVPCYDFLVDHPMYYADSLDEAPSCTTLFCADLTHADYAKRFYPHVKRTLFFPTGGCTPAASVKPWNERSMDVLFIGSFKYHSDCINDDFAEAVISYMQTHTGDTFEQAIACCAQNTDSATKVSEEQLKFLTEKYRFLETNVTALYRKSILASLLDAGITVHVYGNGWTATGLTEHPQFILHSPVTFEEGLSLMGDTKILLNHMAWFKHGSGERIFNAMAQGAVCATDSSRDLDDILTDRINCLIYRLDDLHVAEQIKTLLSDPEKASAIIKEGLITAAAHTWQQHMESYLFFE